MNQPDGTPDAIPDAIPEAIPEAIMGRLRWQCRRGMLELDCILVRYLDDHYLQVDAAEQQQFQALLTAQDPELQQWLLNGESHPDPAFHALITRIRGI